MSLVLITDCEKMQFIENDYMIDFLFKLSVMMKICVDVFLFEFEFGLKLHDKTKL